MKKNKEDSSKKDELLAKLLLKEPKKTDSETSIFKLTSVEEPKIKYDTLPPKPPATKDEPKKELLSKLFGNNTTSNNTVNKNDDLFGDPKPKDSSKVSQMPWEAQEISFNNNTIKKSSTTTPSTTQQNGFNGTKVESKNDDHFDFFSKLNSNTTKPQQNGHLSRPKLDNKLLFPDIHKSNHFVEDVEEIVL